MDIALFPGQKGRAWAETMINLGARKLINTANIVGGDHLKDGLARIRFMEDIKTFVMEQFSATRTARTDEDCMQCLKNIRAENENLLEQSADEADFSVPDFISAIRDIKSGADGWIYLEKPSISKTVLCCRKEK
ncbi:hypothetical protein [Kosakonia radicincitans]|uniref:hypothetical protein n=1 Tax=Kosakonia radicincitans TaxID=283686 RepID=UPI0030824658